jgi:hypothetical protein
MTLMYVELSHYKIPFQLVTEVSLLQHLQVRDLLFCHLEAEKFIYFCVNHLWNNSAPLVFIASRFLLPVLIESTSTIDITTSNQCNQRTNSLHGTRS